MRTRSIKRYQDSETGFTLVELLVVIAIIAILTAIAVPTFLDQRKSANDTALRSDIKNAATAAQTALTQYGSWDIINSEIGNGSTTIFLNNDSGVKVPGPSGKYWNETGKLPPVAYSKGTYIEFVHIIRDIPGSRWVAHNELEFCLSAAHVDGKKYNWKQENTEGHLAYAKLLFYDVKLGGLVDITDITKAITGKTDIEAAEISSCHGYGLRYIETVGGTE